MVYIYFPLNHYQHVLNFIDLTLAIHCYLKNNERTRMYDIETGASVNNVQEQNNAVSTGEICTIGYQCS